MQPVVSRFWVISLVERVTGDLIWSVQHFLQMAGEGVRAIQQCPFQPISNPSKFFFTIQSNPQDLEEPADEWISRKDRSGKRFYTNAATGKTNTSVRKPWDRLVSIAIPRESLYSSPDWYERDKISIGHTKRHFSSWGLPLIRVVTVFS